MVTDEKEVTDHEKNQFGKTKYVYAKQKHAKRMHVDAHQRLLYNAMLYVPNVIYDYMNQTGAESNKQQSLEAKQKASIFYTHINYKKEKR